MKKSALVLLIILACTLISAAKDQIHLKSWTLEGQVDIYHPNNLWELINGAADSYLSYGFIELRAFEVSRNSLHFIVHVYDMGSPLSAFGIYRSENPPVSDSVKIGAETQFSDYLAVLLSGRYYVKVESIKGKVSDENSRSLIEEIHTFLGSQNDFPAELSLLPQEHVAPLSESYVLDSFLGVTELRNALMAFYQDRESRYRLFVMPNQDVDAFFQSLAQSWKRQQMGKGVPVYVRDIPYIGPVGISVRKGTLVGIVDLKDEGLMKKILLEWVEKD